MTAPDPADRLGSTRQALIEAAGRLFAEHGFDGTSTRAIATLAKVNLAAIHYHFGSKEALFVAIFAGIGDFPAIGAGIDRRLAEFAQGRRSPKAAALLVRDLLALQLTSMRRIGGVAGTDAPWEARLVMREMSTPSSAHALIVERIIAPIHARWIAIHRMLKPDAPPIEAHVWAFHIPAMCKFFMTDRLTVDQLIGADPGIAAGGGTPVLTEADRQTTVAMIGLLGLPVPGDLAEARS